MAVWGQETVGDGNSSLRRVYVCGQSPGGTLNSVHVHLGSVTGGAKPRVAIYAGGVADDDPTGATLVEDLGNVVGSAPGWFAATSPGSPAIPAGRLWIAYKANSGSTQITYGVEERGDFTEVVSSIELDMAPEADPWPQTLGAEDMVGVSVLPTTPSLYLDYTPAGGTTTVTIDQSDPQQVEVGSTVQLSATVTNGDGATTWASDDEAVATVDASGLVSGVSVGSATITATNNGVSDSITVNVEAAPAQPPTVTITNPAGNIAVTEGTTIVATATATDPVDGDLSAEIEWTSSVDGALGTGASIQIDTDGWTEGNRTITATATNAAELDGSASFVLTIGEAPEPPEPEPSFDAARFAINAAGGIA